MIETRKATPSLSLFQGLLRYGPVVAKRCILAFVVILLTHRHGIAAGPEYRMTGHRSPSTIFRATFAYTASGVLKVPGEKEIVSVPMKVDATGGFSERVLEIATGPSKTQDAKRLRGDQAVLRSVRHYDRLEVEMTMDDQQAKPELRQDRRLIIAAIRDGKRLLYSPRGFFHREELDLIELPGDPLLWSLLLPNQPVAVGSKWQIDNTTLAMLLSLDAVGESSVFSELISVDGSRAKIEMDGSVQGAIDGVATQIEIKARYFYDLSRHHVTSLQLVTKEIRDVGHVTPGVDVVARITVRTQPLTQAEALTDKALAGLRLQPNDAVTPLTFVSKESRFRCQHDRHWFVLTDNQHATILRRMFRGELVAQCNITPLPEMKKGKEITLSQYQDDISRSLGKTFGRFVTAKEYSDREGKLIYRVEATGKASELPVRWLYYLVADTSGRRMSVVFTMEHDLVKQFATADQSIVASLEMEAPVAAAEPTPTGRANEKTASPASTTPMR